MRIPRLYLDAPLQAHSRCTLDEPTAHHVARVLRMKTGQAVQLFDGRGREFQGVIASVEKRSVNVDLQEPIERNTESPLQIHLGQGISKGERMDFTLQKSVELGVTHITPLWTAYCQVNLDAKRVEKRMEHWRRVIISACEQCGRNVLPTLWPPQSLDQWIKQLPEQGLGLILDPQQPETMKSLSAPNGPVYLAIGPEGGLNEDEITLARKNGFHGLCLGPRILRTETAALAALAAMQLQWGDFR